MRRNFHSIDCLNRWGDALPQTVAAGLFLKRSEISFTDIPGYEYGAGAVCPENLDQYVKLKCTCNQNDWKSKLLIIEIECNLFILNRTFYYVAYNTMRCLSTFMKAVAGNL